MYGVSEQLMQRMQKRMKEKIYREMIEEQQKYKKKYKDRHKDTNAPARFKTDPNQHPQEYEFNKYEDAKHSPFLHEQSTFLPVINKRYSPSENETSDSRVNPEYKKYITRRSQRINNEPQHPPRKRTSASAVFEPQDKKAGKAEESEEEAEQYLNECEQIINNLRLLNKRNQDKLKERQSKKQQQQSSPKSKSFSANVFADSPEYRLNSFNSNRRGHNLKNTSLTDPYRNQELPNNSFRVNSSFRGESPQNQFSEFSDLETKPRERANALTISVNSNPNAVGMRKEAEMREKAESQPKAKENFKRLSPIRKEEEHNQEEKEEAEEPQEEKAEEIDKRSQAREENKRQKAIVKYLKKARLRGNLLYQKIQSKKSQPKKPEQPNDNPQDPASNDPNAAQQPNANSSPQNQPPNADNSSAKPPARQ